MLGVTFFHFYAFSHRDCKRQLLIPLCLSTSTELDSHLTDFRQISRWGTSLNFIDTFQFVLKSEKRNTLLKAQRVIMITSRRLRGLVVSSIGRDMAFGYIKSMIDCQSVSTVRRNL